MQSRKNLFERINSPGHKKILSLDGGGIRGLITIEVLAEIEKQLRKGLQNPQLVLSDYFDLIAGTSTGAIIATTLSLGWPVEKIRHFYIDQGQKMFDHAHWWKFWHGRYAGEHLKESLQREFGDLKLGSDKLRTLLMIVMRNVTTDQPWIVSNNPSCRFNQLERIDCHLQLPIWQLVRASTAAPSFFPPESIKVGAHEFVFVDGSISSATNPAFFAFVRAVARPYDICWPTGEHNLLMVSVGTGSAPHLRQEFKAEDYGLLDVAMTVPQSLILSTVVEQDMMCRIFGNCVNGLPIDKEVGDLLGIETPGGSHLFTYARYNEELTESGLKRMGLSAIRPENVQKIDSVDHLDDLVQIGRGIARQVKAEHFVMSSNYA